MDKLDRGTVSFIDFKTPNCRNDRICSVAIVATKGGFVVSEEFYLVNPESVFDDNNIRDHKILPTMVRDKPTFPEVWETVKHYFTNGIIAAHNASFQLDALCKTLFFYKMDIPDFYYICTMDIVKRFHHKSHSLESLCNEYKVNLETHHGSFYDALACKELFAEFQKRNIINMEDLVRCYRVDDDRKFFSSDSMLKKAINELDGTIRGLVSDHHINQEETAALQNWMDTYVACFQQSQFEELLRILKRSVEDKTISSQDLKKIDLFIKNFQLKRSAGNDATQAMQVLIGIVRGLLADEELNDEEILSLQKWMQSHKYLSGNFSFNKIEKKLSNILEDGIITQDEKNELFEDLNLFIHPDRKAKGNTIVFEKMSFCLTGHFNKVSRSDISRMITENGGTIQANITKKTNYLLVGERGEKSTKFGKRSGKLSKALQLQQKGSEIKIISEAQLLHSII